VFNAAIFKRMKADDGGPATRAQPFREMAQRVVQVFEFAIHGNS